MPGVSSSPCQRDGRQPAKQSPRGPSMRRHDPHHGAARPGLAAREEGLGFVEQAPAWWRPAQCRGCVPPRRLPASRRRQGEAGCAAVPAAPASPLTARSRSTAARVPAGRRRAGHRPHRRRVARRCWAPGGEPAARRDRRSPTCRSPRHRARADRWRGADRRKKSEETDKTDSRHNIRHREPQPARAIRCFRASPKPVATSGHPAQRARV